VRAPARKGVSRGALFAVGIGFCWLSAGSEPLWRAVSRVLRPNDFTPDYVTAVAWIREGKAWQGWPAVLEGATANGYAQSLGARGVRLLGPYYVHPPTALLIVMPLAAFAYPTAVALWLALSLTLLALLALLLEPLALEAGVPLRPPLLFLLLLLWPPVLTNLQLGQWSIVLAVALAAGHRAWARGDHRRGAGWMGLAAALKLTPLVLLPFLFLRDRRAALRFGLVFTGLCLLALPLGGPSAWVALLREAGPNAAAWQTYWHNTLSLTGLWSRLFVGGEFAQPLEAAPLVARALVLVSASSLLGIAAFATRGLIRRATERERDREDCVLALWYILVVLLNPLAWAHYAILLLLPAALAARGAQVNADRRARALAGGGLALLSIPKETLLLVAGPLPASPIRGLALSAHLLGALLLFASAARGAFRSREAGA
jgi:alpha-1,2-mannosyltransferase